jgi:hypothetical protein
MVDDPDGRYLRAVADVHVERRPRRRRPARDIKPPRSFGERPDGNWPTSRVVSVAHLHRLIAHAS